MTPLSKGSRASLIFFLICLGFALALGFAPNEEATREAEGYVILEVQGHSPVRAPENVLGGFAKALEAGVHTLELDTVMKQGVLRVQHDLEPFPAAGAPRLEEIIALAEEASSGAIRYSIETRLDPTRPAITDTPEAYVGRLGSIIEETGIAGRVSIQSFDWRTLALFRESYPEINRVYLTAEQDWLDTLQRHQPDASPWLAGRDIDEGEGIVPELVAAEGGQIWSPHYKDLLDADLDSARSLGLRVIVWTVNDPAHMADLIDRGVDGIVTDDPATLNQVLADKGLPQPARFPANP